VARAGLCSLTDLEAILGRQHLSQFVPRPCLPSIFQRSEGSFRLSTVPSGIRLACQFIPADCALRMADPGAVGRTVGVGIGVAIAIAHSPLHGSGRAGFPGLMCSST